MLASPTVKSIFLEDVENYFSENDIPFTENVTFVGKSGYSYKFPFVLPRTKNKPERIVQTINNPTGKQENILLSWLDTKENRKSNSKLLVIMNDSFAKIPSSLTSALTNLDIVPIPWSKREDYLSDFKSS